MKGILKYIIAKKIPTSYNVKKIVFFFNVGLIMLAFGCNDYTRLPSSSLEDNFINPPQHAKPRTWMHAMSGNMTKEGLSKDLEFP